MSAGYHTVHVRVNDAATGQPTPVRVRFEGPNGEYLAPFGRLTEFALGYNEDVGGNLRLLEPAEDGGKERIEKKYAFVDGSFEISLPADPVNVFISKGPEYRPIQQQVTLGPGKLALRFTIERWIDLREQGWYSGDMRAHFLSPQAALIEGAAEDVAVVNLLFGEIRMPLGDYPPIGTKQVPAIPNVMAFSGQRPALEIPGHMVVVNSANHHPELGAVGLLNSHRVVYPLRFGGPNGKEDWSLTDWCDQCHRKGGLVVWSHDWGDSMALGLPWGEGLADLILGKIDAFEMAGLDAYGTPVFQYAWYDILRCGLRVPIVGCSAKRSNTDAVGRIRTYARLQPNEALTYKSWIEAARAGRTFVTNGPLLTLSVGGLDPGATLDLPSSVPSVRVQADARSLVPFDRLEVVVNGEVAHSVEATPGVPTVASLEVDVAIPEGGWVAARCTQTRDDLRSDDPYAHTSPVYVTIDGKPRQPDPQAVATLIGHLDKMQTWAENQGRYDNDRQREHLVGIFRSARHELVKRSQT